MAGFQPWLPMTTHRNRRSSARPCAADRAAETLPESGTGTLPATQPAALNDPLERATRCVALYGSDDHEAKEIVRALDRIVPEHPLTDSDVQCSLKRLGTQAWNELFRKQLSLRFGVVSFSLSPIHPLLWAHYADSGTGMVIGYDVSVLKTVVTGDGQLSAVQYFDEPPISAGQELSE